MISNNRGIFWRQQPSSVLRAEASVSSSKDDVPIDDYEIPLGTAEVVRQESSVTIVEEGAQVDATIVMKTGKQLKAVEIESANDKKSEAEKTA